MERVRIDLTVALAGLALGAAGCARWAGEGRFGRVSSLAAARPEARRPAVVAPGPGASLDDYLAIASAESPAIRAAFERFRSALEKVPQARALPDPVLGLGYFVREVETRVGPQRAKLSVSQAIPWAGKRGARADVAVRAAEAALARYEGARLAVAFRVKEAWWDYWFLSRRIEVTGESFRLLGQLEEVARARYAAGEADYSAVTKAQVELGKLEDQLASLNDMRAPASAALEAAIGRKADAALPWPKDAPPEAAADVEYARLLAALEERSPELAAGRAAVARESAAVDAARASGRPDVMLGLDYVFVGPAPVPVPESGKDAVVPMVSITLPFARAKYRAAEREARLARGAAELDLADATNGLAAELRKAVFDYRDSERKIGLYRDTLLPKARQSLEAARTAFEAARADFLELIDAERTLLEFDLALAHARADRAIALARIEMLVGGEIAAAGEGGTRVEGE